MSALILLPFGVFFTCCILQFWYLKKVRDALIARHIATFLAVEKSSIFPMQGLYKFARGSRYKELGDARLNQHVRNLKRLMIVGYSAWGVYAISLFTMPLSAPRFPLNLANGSYANGCCEPLVLRNGRMTLGKQQISYVVESDKEGMYVLPTFYVGATENGFVVRRNGFALKLRLNHATPPSAIELMDDTDGSVFSFHRVTTDLHPSNRP